MTIRTLDLLCHRYGNPAFFIDTALACGTFSQSLDEMHRAAEDDRLWDIYLRSDMQKSFFDWKSDVLRSAKAEDGMTQKELIAAEKDAMNILRRVKFTE